MRRIDLLAIDEVADGEMKMVVVDGTDQVLVINNGGEFTAVQGVCSHEYFELDKGFLTAGTLTCALHLSRFDLSDGEPLDPPAELPLEVYPVVVEDGRVLIEVRRRPAADQRGVARPVTGCRAGRRWGRCRLRSALTHLGCARFGAHRRFRPPSARMQSRRLGVSVSASTASTACRERNGTSRQRPRSIRSP